MCRCRVRVGVDVSQRHGENHRVRPCWLCLLDGGRPRSVRSHSSVVTTGTPRRTAHRRAPTRRLCRIGCHGPRHFSRHGLCSPEHKVTRILVGVYDSYTINCVCPGPSISAKACGTTTTVERPDYARFHRPRLIQSLTCMTSTVGPVCNCGPHPALGHYWNALLAVRFRATRISDRTHARSVLRRRM